MFYCTMFTLLVGYVWYLLVLITVFAYFSKRYIYDNTPILQHFLLCKGIMTVISSVKCKCSFVERFFLSLQRTNHACLAETFVLADALAMPLSLADMVMFAKVLVAR